MAFSVLSTAGSMGTGFQCPFNGWFCGHWHSLSSQQLILWKLAFSVISTAGSVHIQWHSVSSKQLALWTFAFSVLSTAGSVGTGFQCPLNSWFCGHWFSVSSQQLVLCALVFSVLSTAGLVDTGFQCPLSRWLGGRWLSVWLSFPTAAQRAFCKVHKLFLHWRGLHHHNIHCFGGG